MFESAELGHKIDKEIYDAEVPKLRVALLDAQFDLAQKAAFPVIILVGGVDGAASMPNGQPRRSLDATRAEELFGFMAQVPLRDGIERTVAWYRSAARTHAVR